MADPLHVDDAGMLVTCRQCGQKNRVAFEKLGHAARCGQCKEPMAPGAVPLEAGSTVDFDRLIAKSAVPVVVDYWAPWCGPCRMVAPVVAELSEEYAGKVNFVKMNTDDNPAVPTKYGIRSIPSLLVFKPGEDRPVETIVGFRPKSDIKKRIDAALS